MIALSAEHRFPVWLAQAHVMRGYTLSARGEITEGLALARRGLADRMATESRWHQTYFVGLLARCCERAGQVEEALELLTTALEAAERTGERWFEAELHRLRGEWLMTHRRDESAEAAASLGRALAVARAQRAKFWELRASISLARLWRDEGRRTDARDLLAPVYGWFTERFDTPDLQDAKALLDELRA